MLLAEVIDWTLALVPVLLLALLFVWLDVFKLMSAWEMLALLILGGAAALLAWPISGRLIDQLPLGFSFYSRFVAPWIEEALKGAIVIGLFATNRIGYKLDALISGFAIGAGFSVVENIFYLVRYPELMANVWLVRGLGTAVMHGSATAVLAVVAHEMAERKTRERASRYIFNPLWFVPGYILAGLGHMVFNQFPDRPALIMAVTLVSAPIVLILLLRFGEHEAQGWLEKERGEHRAALAAWQAGDYPADASGKRIAALAARAKPAEAAHIRGYCAALTELVLAAEEELLDRDRAIEPDKRQRLGELLAAVEAHRRALGRSGYRALKPLLPFSRNDWWEISELKELLGKDG